MRPALVCLLAASTAAAGEPVKAHAPNPRYLEWRGKPVVLVTSAEHCGAVVNPDFDSVKYLDALRADGLPYTRVFAGTSVEPAGAVRHRAEHPGLGEFVNRLDLSAARPDREVVLAAPGCVARCLAVPGKEYAVYLRGRKPTPLTLKVPAGRWRDVRTEAVVRTDAATSDGTLTLPAAAVADGAAVRVTRAD